jgi:hypothetical protein
MQFMPSKLIRAAALTMIQDLETPMPIVASNPTVGFATMKQR